MDFLRSAFPRSGTGGIFGLWGMGGVGKTTLALKLAEELAPQYSDAQIYLDLKGVAPQPLSSAEAMAYIVRAFHPEAQIPDNTVQLGALFRSVLHDKQALLLMDNAASREQIEPLMPSEGSLLLLTSRFHFHLPGLVSRDLDQMSLAESRELLLRIAKRIGEQAGQAEEIARLCGGLPLALRLAGSTLVERKDLSPEAYTRRLTAGKERFGAVEASLQLSYDLLPEDLQRYWRALSVFVGSFDPAAAAAVWELEEDSTKGILSQLVHCSLVEWEDNGGVYRLHDLARHFAIQQLQADERKTVWTRSALYFLRLLAEIRTQFNRGGDDIQIARRMLNIHWLNIKESHHWVVQLSSHDDETTSSLWPDFTGLDDDLFGLFLLPIEKIEWAKQDLTIARLRRDRKKECVAISSLGSAYSILSETNRATECYEQALAIAREIGDRKAESIAIGNMGAVYAQIGQTQRAIELYKQQLAIDQEFGYRRGEGFALGNLGAAYARLGEPRQAIDFNLQRLEITRETADRRSEGVTLGNLGAAYMGLGETHRAVGLFEQALAIAREIGDRRGEARALANLGNSHEKLGETQRAIDHYEQRLTIAREVGDPGQRFGSLISLGKLYEDLGKVDRSFELFNQGLCLAREIGDIWGESRALSCLARSYLDIGNVQNAIDAYKQVLAIGDQIGDGPQKVDALGGLANAYAALGEDIQAIRLYHEQLQSAQDLGNKRVEAQALLNFSEYHRSVGEIQAGVDLVEQVLAIAREKGDRRWEAGILGKLATAYSDLSNTQRAIELHEQAIAIARDVGDRRMEGQDLGSLGTIHAAQGELAKAIQLFEKALEIASAIGDKLDMALASGNLGRNLIHFGEYARAADLLERAAEYWREIGDPSAERVTTEAKALRALLARRDQQVKWSLLRYWRGNFLGALGLAYAALDEPKRAIEFYERHLAIAREIGDQAGQAKTSWNLGITLERQGDLVRAVTLIQSCVDYEREIGDPDAEKHASYLETLRASR